MLTLACVTAHLSSAYVVRFTTASEHGSICGAGNPNTRPGFIEGVGSRTNSLVKRIAVLL